MEGVAPGWQVPPEMQGDRLPQSSAVDELDHYIKAAHAGMSMGAVSLD